MTMNRRRVAPRIVNQSNPRSIRMKHTHVTVWGSWKMAGPSCFWLCGCDEGRMPFAATESLTLRSMQQAEAWARCVLGCAAQRGSSVILVQPSPYDCAHMSHAGPRLSSLHASSRVWVAVRTATSVRAGIDLPPVFGQSSGSIQTWLCQAGPVLARLCLVRMYRRKSPSCLPPGEDPVWM